MIENLPPIISSFFLLCTLFFCIVAAIKTNNISYHRNLFICTLALWMPAVFILTYRQIKYFNDDIIVTGMLHNSIIIAGMVGFIAILGYGLSVLFYNRINKLQLILYLSPAVISLILNIVLTHKAGVPIDNYFESWDEVWANIKEPRVISTLFMLWIQLSYTIFLLYNTLQLIPIYNRFLKFSQSNEKYNMKWLYRYVICSIIIAGAYFMFAININYHTQNIFPIITAIGFIFMTGCVNEYNFFPKFNEVNIAWKFPSGWYIVEENKEEPKSSNSENHKQLLLEIEHFIIENELYSNVEFSMKELLNYFPALSTVQLIEILENEGTTFQSFIRRIRINKAIDIIDSPNNDEQLLFKDIYYKVGFSHYSSFSRAFSMEKGCSPSAYNGES